MNATVDKHLSDTSVWGMGEWERDVYVGDDVYVVFNALPVS